MRHSVLRSVGVESLLRPDDNLKGGKLPLFRLRAMLWEYCGIGDNRAVMETVP